MDDDIKLFGQFIRSAREHKGLSLRAVEQLTEISNAYLSQLEQGKIKQPSPVILHKLSELYEVSYVEILRLIGYPVPDEYENKNSASNFAARIGTITHDEEEELLNYLEFLRSKRKRS